MMAQRRKQRSLRQQLFIALVGAAIPALSAGSTIAGDFSGDARGTTTGGFLKVGVGARAVAMGEAYAAVADTVETLYWNPAGLTLLPARSATFMHADYLNTSFLNYMAYAQPWGGAGAFGASLQYFGAGSIARTDATGAETGSFAPRDVALSLGYGSRLESGFAVGAAGKLIDSRIIRSARTAAVDLGLLSPWYRDERWRFALAVHNLGGRMKFNQESEQLPLALRIGSVYRGEGWKAALDIGLPRDNGPYAALGAEVLLPLGTPGNLAARAGYNTRTARGLEGLAGFSTGLGIASQGWAMDYGFLPFGRLGIAHRLSVSFRIGTGGGEPQAALPAPAQTSLAAPPPDPVDPATQRHVAAAREAAGNRDFAKAADEYGKALALRPEDQETRIALSQALVALGLTAEARGHLTTARWALPVRDARRTLVVRRLGDIAEQQGNFAQAKQLYLESLQIARDLGTPDAGVVEAYLGLARCLRHEGKLTAAARNYEKALELAVDEEVKEQVRKDLTSLQLEQQPPAQ